MNIQKYGGIKYYNPAVNNNRNNVSVKFKKNTNGDSFVFSKPKQVAFSGIFSRFFGTSDVKKIDEKDPNIPYEERLSAGLKRVMDVDVPAKNLKNILTGKDLRIILPVLSTQNFISSTKNQESGIYGVDLDYITSFSYNGNDDIFDTLDRASEYANYHHRKTGKNFVFAITDNDTVEGLMHSIAYISEHPEQFQYLSFVPGIKMSFAHRAPNSTLGYENSRMLIYGLNPFSDNVNLFVNGNMEDDGFDGVLTRRQNMVYDFIKEASKLYKSFIYKFPEFTNQNAISLKKDFGQSDLYWRVREYISSKGDTEVIGFKMTPKEIFTFAEDIFSGMDQVYKGSDNSPLSIIMGDGEEANLLIKKLFDKYSTHYSDDSGQIESEAENVYSNLIDCLSKENPEPIMALSAPYYFTHHFERPGAKSFANVVGFINVLQERSNGMLIGFESVTPSYDLDKKLTSQDIENFNEYIKENTNLLEVGGSFATRKNDELPIRSR